MITHTAFHSDEIDDQRLVREPGWYVGPENDAGEVVFDSRCVGPFCTLELAHDFAARRSQRPRMSFDEARAITMLAGFV